MSSGGKGSRRLTKKEKKHFLEGKSNLDRYKSIRKFAVPNTRVHGSKKKKWDWREDLDND